MVDRRFTTGRTAQGIIYLAHSGLFLFPKEANFNFRPSFSPISAAVRGMRIGRDPAVQESARSVSIMSEMSVKRRAPLEDGTLTVTAKDKGDLTWRDLLHALAAYRLPPDIRALEIIVPGRGSGPVRAIFLSADLLRAFLQLPLPDRQAIMAAASSERPDEAQAAITRAVAVKTPAQDPRPSDRKLAPSPELPYNGGRNQAAPASPKPIALAAADAEEKRPAGRSKTNAADPSGLISPVDIQYIPGRVSITLLRDPQPFTPEPGAGGILSSQMQFFARPIAGAFTNRQGCKVCDRIGFVQITSSRLDIRGSTINSIYWIGQLLRSNRSMHIDAGIPYSGSIDPTSNRELPFIDQPGGYDGHYWDGTTITLLKQDFEVHVVCLAGLEKGATYGGVMWGHQFTLAAGVGATINDYRVNRWQQRWDQPNNIFKNLVGPGL